MDSSIKKLASGLLVSGLLITSVISISTVLVASGDTNQAVTYLQSKSINAWSAMALSAAGKTADVSGIRTLIDPKATDYETAIMAIAAQNQSPRTYPATDYVEALKSLYDGTQLGDVTILNDDVFGILALRAAGLSQSDSVITGVRNYLLLKQNSDGGWGFAVGGDSDTNTTAVAVMALLDAGVAKADLAITKAVSYLKGTQNSDGGFPYDPVSQWDTNSDASSDAWIIATANKLGEDPKTWLKDGKNPVDHLLSLQDPSGFFKWQSASAEDSYSPVTTSYAVIALTGKSFPVGVYVAPTAPHVNYRIAGRDSDLCVGETNASNPLELVKSVVASCNTDYHITETSFGSYIDRIGTDTAAGSIGWLYTVNNAVASVGASDYVLKADDVVLWYFADYQDQITRISLSSTEVNSGSPVTATVEYYNGTAWQPLSGASVHVVGTIVATDSSGHSTLNLSDGSYKVYATKDGYLRTESDALVVGTKVENEFPLSVTLPGDSPSGGSGQGGSGVSGISFTLGTPSNETSLGFGNLSLGQPIEKTLTITNKSQGRLYIEAIVAGDEVFRNYLSINNASWRMFNDKIDGVSGESISVELSVPPSYTGGGTRNGTLTIWGTPTN